METVLIQSLRSESAKSRKEHYACFLWDLANFCEHVSPELLWERAAARGFNLSIVAVSLNQYRGRRFLGLDELAVDCGFPLRGIAAGCGFATFWVQVYAMDPLEHWQRIHDRLGLTVFIDDLMGETADEHPHKVVGRLTAGAAAPAYAGIPITHRDINHAVTFVTGHLAGTGKTELLDWGAISRGSPVIVIYMAMSKLEVIANKLMEAGRSRHEPIAIVTKATTEFQKHHITTLSQAAADVDRFGLEPPSIVVVGDVVNFTGKLDWLGLEA